MSRIREEAHHYPLREAVTRAIAVTGCLIARRTARTSRTRPR